MRSLSRWSVAVLALAALLPAVACGGGDPDPNNELPFGYVDKPEPNTVIGPGQSLVGGWALDDTKVREVRVYLDGKYKGKATLDVERPDVAAAHPKYARPDKIHGWNARIDFGITPGPHAILVQAVDERGATRDIGLVQVTGR